MNMGNEPATDEEIQAKLDRLEKVLPDLLGVIGNRKDGRDYLVGSFFRIRQR